VGRTVTDVTASEETANSPANSNAGKLLTKVPGRARPRTEALKEFEEGVVDLRCRMKPAFWPLLIPKAEDMFRWRAQLECGCVHEVLTPGKDTYPDHGSSTDPITGHRLLAGEYWCTADHGTAKPYRDIVEWVDRKVREFPPDPEEPEHGLDPETWEKIRHTEPHSSAFWRVKLSCGHLADSDVTDVEWKPEDGPKLVTEKRLAEIRRDFDEYWAAEGSTRWLEEGPERDHVRKMLDLGWPRPEPEEGCYACTRARRLTGYQRIGWLVPRPKPTPPPLTERQVTEKQLARAEAEVQRLRRKLERAGDA
jgi:hypothetical protein